MYLVSMAGHPRRTPSPLGQAIARQLQEHLANREISQRQAALKADISPSQLSRYVRAISSPTIEEFLDICNAIGASPAAIISAAILDEKYNSPEEKAEAKLRMAQHFMQDMQ